MKILNLMSAATPVSSKMSRNDYDGLPPAAGTTEKPSLLTLLRRTATQAVPCCAPVDHTQTLPPHILMHVFSMLPTIRDKLRLRLVCRRFLAFESHHESWAGLDAFEFSYGSKGSKNSDDNGNKCGVLLNDELWIASSQLDSALQALMSRIVLKRLWLDRVNPVDTVTIFAQIMQALRHGCRVELDNLMVLEGKEIDYPLYMLIKTFSSSMHVLLLDALQLSHTAPPALLWGAIGECSLLRVFRWMGGQSLDETLVVDALRGKQLRRLSLHGIDTVTSDGLAKICNACRGDLPKSLSVSCRNLNMDQMPGLLDARIRSNLRELAIKVPPTVDSLTRIFTDYPRLNTLKIRGRDLKELVAEIVTNYMNDLAGKGPRLVRLLTVGSEPVADQYHQMLDQLAESGLIDILESPSSKLDGVAGSECGQVLIKKGNAYMRLCFG